MAKAAADVIPNKGLPIGQIVFSQGRATMPLSEQVIPPIWIVLPSKKRVLGKGLMRHLWLARP